MRVGERRGALEVVAIDRGRVHLVCDHGHRDTRPFESVRVSPSPRCKWCVPAPTPLQLRVLQSIREHEQETAQGMSRADIGRAIGRSPQHVLEVLASKGWIERDEGAWCLTDEGIDVLEGPGLRVTRVRRASPVRDLTPPVRAAIEQVAATHGVHTADLMGRSKSRSVARARQEAMVRVRALGYSLPEVGRIFGRDHTTVVHACRQVAARAEAAE